MKLYYDRFKERGTALAVASFISQTLGHGLSVELIEERPRAEVRPPLGLRPASVVQEIRQGEILEAIGRYQKAGVAIPQPWIDELVAVSESMTRRT
jgi:hypothetical protein